MNKAILTGRLTADPVVRYSRGENPVAIANYTLAVDRRYKRQGEPEADFIKCVAMGKLGEHAERYYHKGIKINVAGEIRTNRFTNRDGQTVYTTEVYVNEQEFAESKNAGGGQGRQESNDGGGYQNQRRSAPTREDSNGFVDIEEDDGYGAPFA